MTDKFDFLFSSDPFKQVKKSLERIAASKKLLKTIDLEESLESNRTNKREIHTVASARAASVVQQRTVKVCKRNFYAISTCEVAH